LRVQQRACLIEELLDIESDFKALVYFWEVGGLVGSSCLATEIITPMNRRMGEFQMGNVNVAVNVTSQFTLDRFHITSDLAVQSTSSFSMSVAQR